MIGQPFGLCRIERAGQALIPRGETVLATGDRVTLFAEPHRIQEALAALSEIAAVDETVPHERK